MKFSLRIIDVLGIAVFGLLFGLTYGVPDALENSAKNFVKKQIEKEIEEKYQISSASNFAKGAVRLASDLGYEEKGIRKAIDNRLPEKIAEVVASMCGYDCERKKSLVNSIKDDYIKRIASIQLAQQNLGKIIKNKYVEIVGNLKVDLRIFLGSNAGMFLILVMVSLSRPQAIAQLFIPAVLLLVSTISASVIYIFGQDWFYTILYNDYVGFGYLTYIGVIFGFLMDVAFNKARVTTEIVNGILNAIGSALSVAPC